VTTGFTKQASRRTHERKERRKSPFTVRGRGNVARVINSLLGWGEVKKKRAEEHCAV